jgi:tight adherence protein C
VQLTAPFVIGLAGIAAAVGALVWVLLPTRPPGVLEQRLRDDAAVITPQGTVDHEATMLQRPLSERVIDPLLLALGGVIMRRLPHGQIDQMRALLIQAGSEMRPEAILALKVVGVPLGTCAGIAAVSFLGFDYPLSLVMPVALALAGYSLPSTSLKRRAKKRAKEMRNSLPGVLDLLTLAMEAGLGFESAMMKVSESDTSLMGRELQQVLNEIRLGRPRLDALAAMAERSPAEEVGAFVRAVAQAEPLGVSMANVLRIQSEDLRRLRKLRAEQAGHRAPVLMLLPMLGCIFPCVFIMLLGPAIISVMHSLSH